MNVGCAECRAVQFFTPGVPMVYYVVSAAGIFTEIYYIII